MKIGINAARARSGGAVAHLVGLLNNCNPQKYGIKEVHVFAYKKLLEALPVRCWLKLHCPKSTKKNIFEQLLWERFTLPGLLRNLNCDLLFNVDAGSVCRFQPAVTASRDMLSYEPGEIQRYGFSCARIRLWALKFVQNAALRHADGVIFLTKYAGKIIQRSTGSLRHLAFINHGVSDKFKKIRPQIGVFSSQQIRILYISNIALYKHQWNVVEAVTRLREKGLHLLLSLVGAEEKNAKAKFQNSINKFDPENMFIKYIPWVDHNKIPAILEKANIFLFASSCENMPNILLEAMSAGLPIACAARGPMPEILGNCGIYFDPEKPDSIADALYNLITNKKKRIRLAKKAKKRSKLFCWKICAKKTLSFLAKVYKKQL